MKKIKLLIVIMDLILIIEEVLNKMITMLNYKMIPKNQIMLNHKMILNIIKILRIKKLLKKNLIYQMILKNKLNI